MNTSNLNHKVQYPICLNNSVLDYGRELSLLRMYYKPSKRDGLLSATCYDEMKLKWTIEM